MRADEIGAAHDNRDKRRAKERLDFFNSEFGGCGLLLCIGFQGGSTQPGDQFLPRGILHKNDAPRFKSAMVRYARRDREYLLNFVNTWLGLDELKRLHRAAAFQNAEEPRARGICIARRSLRSYF